MAGLADLFKQLPAFKWHDCCFPVMEMRLSVTQDLAEHKYWGQDGAKVEATGRQALVIDAKIPFRNGIYPGQSEKWDPMPLYPVGFRAFLMRMAERKTKTLVFPELGPLRCKPRACNVQWSGARQDGVDVDASWIETFDENHTYKVPAVDAYVEGATLDDAMSNPYLKGLAPDLPEHVPDLGDTMRSIAAVGDQVSVLQKRVAGKIDNVAYRLDAISDSMQAARSALTWPIDRACNRLADALTRLKQEVVASGKTLVVFTVANDIAISALVPKAGGDLAALLRLNPQYARTGIVRAGRSVKYFAQKNT